MDNSILKILWILTT